MVLDHSEILYLERAKNELDLAKAIFKLSKDSKLKLEFELKEDSTFFSNVINNAYYCIFYSAKSYLTAKGIKTEVPQEHKRTFFEFKKLVQQGVIDAELLNLYEEVLIRADTLLHIFKQEKGKRGKFTYKTLPQANQEPARESLANAEKFFKNINLIIQKVGSLGEERT
ncbi:MAG: hypothetical protein AABX99_00355 [Nanoarchaeota archaeon]